MVSDGEMIIFIFKINVQQCSALHRQRKQASGGQFLGMESCKYSEKCVSESEDTNDSQVNRPVKRRGPMIRIRSATRLLSSAMKK